MNFWRNIRNVYLAKKLRPSNETSGLLHHGTAFTWSINNSDLFLPRCRCILIIAFITLSLFPFLCVCNVHYWVFTVKSNWVLYLPVLPGGPGGPGNPGGPGKPSLPGGPGKGNPGEPFSPFSPLSPGTPGDPALSGSGRPLDRVKHTLKEWQVKRH